MRKKMIAMALLITLTVATAGCGRADRIRQAREDKAREEESGDEPEMKNEEAPSSGENADKGNADEAVADQVVAEEEYDGRPEIVLLKKSRYETTGYDEYKELFNGSFATPILSERSAKLYPQLAKSMEDDGKTELEFFDATSDEYLETAKVEYAENGEYFYGPYTLNQGVNVKRADEMIVSVFFPVESYMGGAHGSYGNGYVNYETQTGKVLKLADVLTSMTDLPGILQSELEKKYAGQLDMFWDLKESLANYVDGESFSEGDDYYTGYTWAFTYEGIEFYFGPYELAAYAAGDQSVVLRYDEYSSLIRPEYLPDKSVTRGRIVDAVMGMPGLDVNNDGVEDQVYLEYGYDDDWNVNSASITYNDETLSVGDDGDIPDYSDINCYLVETADGRHYAYVISQEYDDYIGLHVYDLNSGHIKEVGVRYLVRPILGYDENDYALYKECALYDPENMYFASRFHFISTFSAIRNYHVGPDGMPVSDDEVYEVASEASWEPITCVKDFEADFVGEDGSLTKDTIKAGETFDLLRTDGETWLDARTSDGRVVRLQIKGEGMELTVNGIDAQELFKELMYAG